MQKSGRLAEGSLDLFSSAGLRIVKGANDLYYRVENYPIDLLRVRDDDIPTFVADGVAQLGVVGRNVLEEARHVSSPEIVMPLGFGRCALAIALPEGVAFCGPASLAQKRIATTYPNLLRAYLHKHSVEAEIVTMHGAVEVAPRLGLATAVCDLVSTGATLEANNLVPVETLLRSEALLIRTPGPIAAEHSALIESMTQRFRGIAASRDSKYVMMNAPRSALAQIADILPGADAPTVMPLAGREDLVAVHAVCQEAVFWETLERLKAAGASAILVLPIEKMM